ncbi:MAG TPA: DNA repair protein RecN [Pyrinomonadaceae bacterium]|jgi:DNA repair protein RecN (Recombination protein N)|nr:DNA repair protein RecN [Pyrinomonadaceae bacterium]
MLALLNISNFALISELKVEFERGLNLLTGETGSGKSIIVDALGVLIGDRFSPELIRAGERHAFVEGLFTLGAHPQVEALLVEAGVAVGVSGEVELVIRRELSAEGRGRVFVNNRLATLTLLRSLRPMLVDIHGQGTQQTLFDPDTHLELLDAFADLNAAREELAVHYRRWSALERELAALRRDEAEKFHLTDALHFQVSELEAARLAAGEDEQLEAERRRLANLEKLTELCGEAYNLTYEESDSTVARLRRLERQVEELSQYESAYRNYLEGLGTARVVLEDLAASLRDFLDGLSFSPARLSEIESRLAEIARLKRKYGGTIESALEHLAASRERLRQLGRTDERAEEVSKELAEARASYIEAATLVHHARVKSAGEFRRAVEASLKEVALEHARFEARISSPEEPDAEDASKSFTASGFDRVEFYFSANAGEPLRPLAKVASGGEASRLMLVLKTSASPARFPRTIVFDEVDAGIGGRVSEAVGLKLKALSRTNQVLCVTHQAQIARFADTHLLVDKQQRRGRTEVGVEQLERRRRVEEIARMLTGAEITEAARRHAREMLKTA